MSESQTAVVVEEQFASLLSLLLAAEVVTPAQIGAMCERLSERLEEHAHDRSASGFLSESAELLMAASRAADIADRCFMVASVDGR